MSLIFTPIVTDNFTPNANPLNPAKWTTMTDSTIYGTARANGGKFESTTATFNNGLTAGAFYTAASFPANQYLAVKVAAWGLGSYNESDGFLRSPDLSGDFGYSFSIIDNGDGVTGEITFGYYDNTENFVTLFDTETAIISVGDEFVFAIVGSTLYLYQNGVLVTPPTVDPDNYYPNTGYLGINVDPQDSASETEWSTFIAGSVIDTGGNAGPITSLTVGVGPYQGSSLRTAFPNVQGLDIFQVINEGGRVVWNLNAVGVATNNPTKPTPGTLLGQYEGSNFQAAFPNPYQLNIFQVISQGGSVVFYVDYQGNAAI